MSKQNFLHTQEKKNKINRRRYQHLIQIIDDDYSKQLLEIKKEYDCDQRKN
jgi:hypothetical protein